MDIDRAGLADFLRRCRESLQPEDVGLPRGQRRRTAGLRREEVAALAHMSPDYYSRLERERGRSPRSRCSPRSRRACTCRWTSATTCSGWPAPAPARGAEGMHVAPGMLRILDRLEDTPAEVVTELGETLRQTRLGGAARRRLARTGPARSLGYRWFTDPEVRHRYHPDDHAYLSRLWASGLRGVVAVRGPRSRAAALAEDLLSRSEEFRQVWELHEVGLRPQEHKRFVHPEVGLLEVQCQTLLDTQQGHLLLVYTAVPGSETAEKLQLLSVVAAG